MAPRAAPSTPSFAPDEIARFDGLAARWWDAGGPLRPLHRINPLRADFVRRRACRHFGRDANTPHPLSGLTLLDVGCGGGLLSEPMARLGAAVTGIDASKEAIAVARLHAAGEGLVIDYRVGTPESLAGSERRSFDLVLDMEVIEHVPDIGGHLGACATLLAPRGLMILSTINRTLRSLALAKFGAEYVLRWLPAGTHDWSKFVRPSELARHLRGAGLELTELSGMAFDPLTDRWRLAASISVNYFAMAVEG
jgi:2-polyprenyl-6-hydroxyphenyl methylase / 3-demethylubiquinone-9 3-methyltransferase